MTSEPAPPPALAYRTTPGGAVEWPAETKAIVAAAAAVSVLSLLTWGGSLWMHLQPSAFRGGLLLQPWRGRPGAGEIPDSRSRRASDRGCGPGRIPAGPCTPTTAGRGSCRINRPPARRRSRRGSGGGASWDCWTNCSPRPAATGRLELSAKP